MRYLILMFFLIGCGDDSQTDQNPILVSESLTEEANEERGLNLPARLVKEKEKDCKNKEQGTLIYVIDDGFYYCDLGEWIAIDLQGSPGQDGNNGVDGKDGKDGSPGKNGNNGVDGKDGAPGQDGKDGTNGSNGLAISKIKSWYDTSYTIESDSDGSPDTNQVDFATEYYNVFIGGIELVYFSNGAKQLNVLGHIYRVSSPIIRLSFTHSYYILKDASAAKSFVLELDGKRRISYDIRDPDGSTRIKFVVSDEYGNFNVNDHTKELLIQ